MKKISLISLLICLLLGGVIGFNLKHSSCELDPLPKQEKSEGLRGVYDIDKNINEKTIDE